MGTDGELRIQMEWAYVARIQLDEKASDKSRKSRRGTADCEMHSGATTYSLRDLDVHTDRHSHASTVVFCVNTLIYVGNRGRDQILKQSC